MHRTVEPLVSGHDRRLRLGVVVRSGVRAQDDSRCANAIRRPVRKSVRLEGPVPPRGGFRPAFRPSVCQTGVSGAACAGHGGGGPGRPGGCAMRCGRLRLGSWGGSLLWSARADSRRLANRSSALPGGFGFGCGRRSASVHRRCRAGLSERARWCWSVLLDGRIGLPGGCVFRWDWIVWRARASWSGLLE